MNKKILMFAILGMFLISFASATFVYKIDNEVNLTVICENNGYCSSEAICNLNVIDPEGSLIVSGENMTNQLSSHVYNITNTVVGDYQVSGYCNDGLLNSPFYYNYKVTQTGNDYQQQEATSYLIVLLGLLIFLTATTYGSIKLPYKNKRSDNGDIIGINDLKYVKIILIAATYGILIWLANIMITISNNYINLGVAMGFFEMIFRTMTSLTYPLLIGYIIFVVIQVVKDFNVNKLLGRGFTA